MASALLGGLVAVAAGVGPLADFFHSGASLIALNGAVLALFVYELARGTLGRCEPAGPGTAGTGLSLLSMLLPRTAVIPDEAEEMA